MAYVVPNSVIQLFKGINLDNRYMHTIYFANEQAQDTAFTAKVFKTFNASQFVRQNATQVKVECDSTELQGVTYLRFKNTRTGTKWYYAFVIGAPQYVNENTSLITFEIDVMQTWFIQAGNILPCLVRREHTNDDTFGTNLENEPIGSDVYDFDKASVNDDVDSNTSGYFNNYSVFLSTSEEPTYAFDYGIFTGTQTREFPANSESECAGIVGALGNSLGSWDLRQQKAEIVDMYTFPTDLADDLYPFNPKQLHVLHPDNFKGYQCKNNKLYGYPFSYLFLTTHNGDSTMLKWEYWVGDNVGENVNFGILSNPIGGGMVECYPKDYNGIEENYDQGIVINNFPKNTGNFNAYEAWVAAGGQTRLEDSSYITKMRTDATALKMAGNAVSGTTASIQQVGSGLGEFFGGSSSRGTVGITQGVATMSSTIANMMELNASNLEARNKINYQWNDAYYEPNIIKGKNTPQLAVSYRTLEFYFYNAHIRTDEAKRIDDFFSMFGYATNRIKTPNITGRQYWNFVQTENCQIAGDMPASSKEAIGRIFDGGITFWHNINQIGNYAQSVTSGTVNNPIV